MTMTLFGTKSQLQEAFAALRNDLVHEDGPRISTMRNYRFAIVPYAPTDEFRLRAEVQKLTNDLVAHGWVVLSISLQKLVLDQVRAKGPEWLERVMKLTRFDGHLSTRKTGPHEERDEAKEAAAKQVHG